MSVSEEKRAFLQGDVSNKTYGTVPQTLGNSTPTFDAASVSVLHAPDSAPLGERSIGPIGSFVFLVNQIIGPGIVALPKLYQVSGWLTTSVLLALTTVLSGFATTMVCEALEIMQFHLVGDDLPEGVAVAVDPNHGIHDYAAYSVVLSPASKTGSAPADSSSTASHEASSQASHSCTDGSWGVILRTSESPQYRIEFCRLVELCLGSKRRTLSALVTVVFCLLLSALNIAAVVVTAAVVDDLIITLAGKTVGFGIFATPTSSSLSNSAAPTNAFAASHGAHGEATAAFGFRSVASTLGLPVFGISLGYLIICAVLGPLGFFSLSETMWVQWVSFVGFFVLTAAISLLFVVIPSFNPERCPLLTSAQRDVIGVVMFSSVYTMTTPSWCNERFRGVSVNRTVWWSSAFSTALKIFFGVLGAMAFAVSALSDDVLVTLADNSIVEREGASKGLASAVAAVTYIYSVLVIGLGIPPTAIYLKYNMLNSQICNYQWATFFSAVFPYLVSWMVARSGVFILFLNWSSLVLNGVINLILPFVVYIIATRCYREAVHRKPLSSSMKSLVGWSAIPAFARDRELQFGIVLLIFSIILLILAFGTTIVGSI